MKNIIKKTLLSLAFPALMFVVMLIVTASNPASYANGNYIFLSSDLLNQICLNASMTVCVALAIWMQLRNGRFDFSSGAAMILTAIVAGNIGDMFGSPYIGLITGVVVAVLLSLLTATIYSFGKVPIVMCTIGMTLLYESLTYLVFDGQGMRGYYSDATLAIFGKFPGVLIPFIIAIAVFYFYSYFTVEGKKGKILANNQRAGVNIGIKEVKNVLITYGFAGILIGLAATIYVSQNIVTPQSGLATSGILFSYIVPVYMGVFIGRASNDVMGIIIASIGMEILYYGLNTINLGDGGWQQIIMGVFVFTFYTFSSQSDNINRFIKTKFAKKKEA